MVPGRAFFAAPKGVKKPPRGRLVVDIAGPLLREPGSVYVLQASKHDGAGS